MCIHPHGTWVKLDHKLSVICYLPLTLIVDDNIENMGPNLRDFLKKLLTYSGFQEYDRNADFQALYLFPYGGFVIIYHYGLRPAANTDDVKMSHTTIVHVNTIWMCHIYCIICIH